MITRDEYRKVVFSNIRYNDFFLQNFLISTTTWNMSYDNTKFLRSFRNYRGKNHNSLHVEFMKRETTTIDRKGRNSVHVGLYEKKIYSHAIGVQLKRFTNRNSWLSINRCLFLTSLPARSVGDILMTSRIPVSKANQPLRGFVLSNDASYYSHEHRKKCSGIIHVWIYYTGTLLQLLI